jgi:hypothetical protein
LSSRVGSVDAWENIGIFQTAAKRPVGMVAEMMKYNVPTISYV